MLKSQCDDTRQNQNESYVYVFGDTLYLLLLGSVRDLF